MPRPRSDADRLPVEPLRRELMAWHERGGIYESLRCPGVHRHTLRRIVAGARLTVDAYIADRVCCAMGVHPIFVWPEIWIAAALGRRRAA